MSGSQEPQMKNSRNIITDNLVRSAFVRNWSPGKRMSVSGPMKKISYAGWRECGSAPCGMNVGSRAGECNEKLPRNPHLRVGGSVAVLPGLHSLPGIFAGPFPLNPEGTTRYHAPGGVRFASPRGDPEHAHRILRPNF